MEAGVAVLDHTSLVLNPHEHVVRVQEVFARLVLVRVLTKTQRIVTRRVSLTVDRLEDVLGVVLEHLLRFFGQLARVVLVLLVQCLVRRGAVLGQGGRVNGVAVSGFVDVVLRRAGCHDALVRATGLEPNATRKDIRFTKLASRIVDRTFRILNELVALS